MTMTRPCFHFACLSLSLLLVTMLTCSATTPVFAQVKSDSPQITVNYQDEDLTVVLKDIAHQAGKDISIPDALGRRRVSLNVAGVSTDQALRQAMAGIKDFMPLNMGDKIQILPVAPRSSQAESDEMNKLGNTDVYRSMESVTVTSP